MKRLILLSTQRSGSTMVCDDIAGTNELGRPSEYFIKVIESFSKLSAEELKRVIEEVDEKGKTGNGVSAVKIMSNQINPIGKALKFAGVCYSETFEDSFYEYFKDSTFVRIKRNDKVAQAVSRVMAQQTDVYHSANSLTGLEGMLGKVSKTRNESGIEYDESAIFNSIRDIQKEEEYIDSFCEKFDISALEVEYEVAVNDRGYIHEIANLLSQKPVTLADRRLKKVSGEISQSWIERYQKSNK